MKYPVLELERTEPHQLFLHQVGPFLISTVDLSRFTEKGRSFDCTPIGTNTSFETMVFGPKGELEQERCCDAHSAMLVHASFCAKYSTRELGE